MRARAARLGRVAGPLLAAMSLAAPSVAQVHAGRAAGAGTATSQAAGASLKARFGLEAATHLLQSTDPDERLRALERIAAMKTPEALAMLERVSGRAERGSVDSRAPVEGTVRSDPRAALVVARGLASYGDDEGALDALADLLTMPIATQLSTSLDPAHQQALGAARVRLAREEAAIALAQSGRRLALEALVDATRRDGADHEPALRALALVPPEMALLGGVALTTPETIALAARTGDLRALDALIDALGVSEVAVRVAAMAALGVAGDRRVLPAAREATRDREPRVREAAADALVRLHAPEGLPAVEALIGDDPTARAGLRLACDARSPGIVRAASARAVASHDDDMRAAAVVALGRQTDPSALVALVALVGDPRVGGDAAAALARSVAPGAMAAIERLATAPAWRRMAARAYLVRRVVRGERSDRLDAALVAMATSRDARDRAVSAEARVATGELPLTQALSDPDPRVQRAGAMGALARPGRSWDGGATSPRDIEDPATRRIVDALDGEAHVPTLELFDRAVRGSADAPLAAYGLAAASDDDTVGQIGPLLESSTDPLVRSHVAMGLARSRARDATGRLAAAYTWEPDVDVRRALVAALAARTGDADAPSRTQALSLAAQLDPDRIVRATAGRAARGEPSAQALPAAVGHEVAWLRLAPAEGAVIPAAAEGLLVGSDGVARAIVFDDEGYALVPGLPPGTVQLRLAPDLAAYESPSPP